MAVLETSKSRTANRQPLPGHGWGREIICDSVAVAMTTTMLDNADDDVGLLWAPAGAVVVGALLSATDMDTNATPTLAIDVGDAADENRLFDGVTVAQTGGSTSALAPTGHLYKYTANTQIRAYIKTAAATPAAGTLKFTLFYFIDPENSDATALAAA